MISDAMQWANCLAGRVCKYESQSLRHGNDSRQLRVLLTKLSCLTHAINQLGTDGSCDVVP